MTVFILFLGLIVAGVGTLSVLRPMLIKNQEATLAQLRADPTVALSPGANPDELQRDDILYASKQYYVALLDAQGNLQADNTLGAKKPLTPVTNHLTLAQVTSDTEQVFSLFAADNTEWRAVAWPIYNGSDAQGILLIAVSTAGVNQVVAQYVLIFTGFGIAVILLGAALTRLLVTATFLPLAEVEQTALEISRGDYSKRIIVASPHTEVGHLGASLNSMLDRLDGSLADRARTIQQMRRFIGDASHELRTPLVSVRGYAELYRMGALEADEDLRLAMERIEKEAIRMSSLVEDLLALARLDERRPLELTALNLNELAQDAALDATAQAPERSITAIPDPQSPLVLGDEHKVRQLMTNLIANALRHTPENTAIEIVISAPEHETLDTPVLADTPTTASVPTITAPVTTVTRPTALARFSIVDHGDGIPEALRDKIFTRFWRADTSRNRETGGSGLGLAIVESIVSAHNGRVTVLETPGGGATFQVDLPRAAPTHSASSGSGEHSE